MLNKSPIKSNTEMKQQKSLLGSCILIFLAGACLMTVLATSLAFGAQSRATQLFGAPTNNISSEQRLYLSLQLLLQEQTLSNPLDPNGLPRPFSIDFGESTASVIQRLENEGIIQSAQALRTYLVYKGLDITLQAGEYTLSPAQSPVEIAYSLQDATPSTVRFRILPGWRMEEIAQSLPTSGLTITPDEFLIMSQSNPGGTFLPYSLPTYASMEGFLYPDTYQFRRDIPIQEFFMSILGNFEQKLSQDIQDGFARQGLDVFGGVTLASIIQREAVVEEEMPLIASVFLNRLAAGMKLDSDPTTQYAIGYNQAQKTWWTNPLSGDDLKTNSTYNTYLNTGLPPGPISNPSLAALKAVAFPAQTPYFYFRARCDGSGKHVFAETYQEHLNNGCP
jgi:UPF0755 protein